MKLSETKSFTLTSVYAPKFKKWNNEERKYEESTTPKSGFKKVYTCKVGEEYLDLSENQMALVLLSVFDTGTMCADLEGREITVKTNGKTGMDIRYFFIASKHSIRDTQNTPPVSSSTEHKNSSLVESSCVV